MRINFNVLDRQYLKYKEEYNNKALEVLNSGYYIGGPEVKSFEEEFASKYNAKYCVSLANGYDALWISLQVLGIKLGDEVLVQSNGYIATINAIITLGATPVFVEPNEFYNMDTNIEHLINDKTKAIIVTHLYGQSTNMKKFCELKEKYNLILMEDCAQAHGAKYKDNFVGSIGDVGCFSFYPSKNLGCFGDGGAILTNNEELAKNIRTFANYGSNKRYYNEVVGTNSRLDSIQAGLLRVKLKHIDELTNERIKIANYYLSNINNELVSLPKLDEHCSSVWHLFVVSVEDREDFMDYLDDNQIQTIIHYPIPPHMQESLSYLGYKDEDFPVALKYSKTIVSLPFYNGMTDEEMKYVVDTINGYKK